MAYLAAVIGVFLFYQYVPRQHKIISIKIAGGLTLGCVLLVLAIAGYEDYSNVLKKRRLQISVKRIDIGKFSEKDPDTLIVSVCNRHKRQLTSYSFDVAGLYPERSTKYAITDVPQDSADIRALRVKISDPKKLVGVDPLLVAEIRNRVLGSLMTGSTRFNSDIIIAPEKCMEITWRGRYKSFPKYEIQYPNGNWENN